MSHSITCQSASCGIGVAKYDGTIDGPIAHKVEVVGQEREMNGIKDKLIWLRTIVYFSVHLQPERPYFGPPSLICRTNYTPSIHTRGGQWNEKQMRQEL